MRLSEFYQYLTSNGLREGTLTKLDALQLAKSVLPTAVRDIVGDLYPCFSVVFSRLTLLKLNVLYSAVM